MTLCFDIHGTIRRVLILAQSFDICGKISGEKIKNSNNWEIRRKT